jgi:hypothetical protein
MERGFINVDVGVVNVDVGVVNEEANSDDNDDKNLVLFES